MEGFTFKNLSDIDTLDQPTDKTKLVGMENGTPVQIPADGLREDRVLLLNPLADDWNSKRNDRDYGDKVKAALLRGDTIWVYGKYSDIYGYTMVVNFRFVGTSGNVSYLGLYKEAALGSPALATLACNVFES